MKHLSAIANDVIQRCAAKLGASSVEKLVEEFGREWKHEMGDYSKKLVEFCCRKVVAEECQHLEETISDGSFSRFTFDMMLAWEITTVQEEQLLMENIGKEREERKTSLSVSQEQDETLLFYSDLMPLLVNNEPSVGQEAFVWFGSMVPLVVDVVNGRFTFETLTAPTYNKLFFPAYDKFLKEIHKCIKHLQKQVKPKGVDFAIDELILHVEGTASSQKVVRHIGATSWPGRLTLTNYALYFEASGVIAYEDAIKIDLSKDIKHTLKPTSTGPWGAPLFDKAIVYESLELSEGIVLEFPEMTSSTRRDHWLALTKEVMLMHQFILKYKIASPIQVWEMQARAMLGIIRLHGAREMLRISPPVPTKFLIFALCDELPKGDYVLQELAESFKTDKTSHSCSASIVLQNLQMYSSSLSSNLNIEASKECLKSTNNGIQSSLECAISQARVEDKEMHIAKATTEGLKEEGIIRSVAILLELLKPINNQLPWLEDVLLCKRPLITLVMIAATSIIFYKEWTGKAMAACLLVALAKMVHMRWVGSKSNDIVVYICSEQRTTIERIVSTQFKLKTAYEILQATNITILKIWSIICSKAKKQSDTVMVVMSVVAVILLLVPLKYLIIAAALFAFAISSKLGKNVQNEKGSRRLREWWHSIPIMPVRVVHNRIQ